MKKPMPNQAELRTQEIDLIKGQFFNMMAPFSLRRKRLVILGLVLVLGLFCLHGQMKPTIERIALEAEFNCSSFFDRLENSSQSWSNDFYEPSWHDWIYFWKPAGNDVVEKVTMLKYFERCLVDKTLGVEKIERIQQFMFPYMDFEKLSSKEDGFWPKYTRWDQDTYVKEVPHFSNADHGFMYMKPVTYDSSTFFWTNLIENYTQPNSKGIVLSIGDFQCADTMRLIRVLRHLGNRLPIEIVHKGDLNEDYKQYISNVARENASDKYPVQEVWFVDVSEMLTQKHNGLFKRFSNKWLAMLFCSFEEVILLDADTVPFVALDQYFQWDQYLDFGAVFFKDRKLTRDILKKPKINVLKRLVDKLLALNTYKVSSPSDVRKQLASRVKDKVALDTIETMFIYGFKHHMESGLVVMNKRKHFVNLLTSLSLQFTSINEYFHGDKEWFWISPFLRNEAFSFHPTDASSVGKLGHVQHDDDDNREFYQVCSVQLSHTDEEGSILWVNGGLNTCKKNSWDYDYKRSERIASHYENVDELRKHYQSPVELEGAIIPDIYIKPWINSGECAQFQYCTLYREGEYGKVFKFNATERGRYQEIVGIWNQPV